MNPISKILRHFLSYMQQVREALVYLIRSSLADYFASCAQSRRQASEYLHQYPKGSFAYERGDVFLAIANFYLALEAAFRSRH